MPFRILPSINSCCFCVNDLKIATGMIALLAIVTNPVLAWAIVRHSYVIRVSGFISSNGTAPDVVDIRLNNLVSFGFGPNAGLAPSCLGANSTLGKVNQLVNAASPAFFRTSIEDADKEIDPKTKKRLQQIQTAIRTIGWIVLIVDIFYLFISIWLLASVFNNSDYLAVKLFLGLTVISMIFSYIYGLMYVVICIISSGHFPIFEFLSTHADLCLWFYFLSVVNTYRTGGRGGGSSSERA